MSTLAKVALPFTLFFYAGGEYVCNAVAYIRDSIYYSMAYEIKINCMESPKSVIAIMQEFSAKIIKDATQINVSDGQASPEYKVSYGRYYVETDIGYIWLDYGEKEIKLTKFKYKVTIEKLKSCLSVNELKKCLVAGELTKSWTMDEFRKWWDGVYRKYCAPESILILFTSDKDRWSYPIHRRPRQLSEVKLTNTMNSIMTDVDAFMAGPSPSGSMPYRRGYFLCGDTGTGKSFMPEYIATKYNRSIFMLILNADGMTDTILINLLSIVPPYSVICIDEIDRQYEFLKSNTNAKVSMSGILTALDGPQRLSHGTIVIMTGNNDKFVLKEDYNALFRPGRIDKTFYLTEPFV